MTEATTTWLKIMATLLLAACISGIQMIYITNLHIVLALSRAGILLKCTVIRDVI